jgi:hypothetical protein
MHKILTAEEELEYRQWARENFNSFQDNISILWHPIIIDECNAMIQEKYLALKKQYFNIN